MVSLTERSRKADFLVIGCGIVGLNIARQLAESYPDAEIVVLEKEPGVGAHASGRNSGVLHAGFYYTADSLKAKFTREGNRLLAQYCRENGLFINQCGKLVVTRNVDELSGLDTLMERGRVNGVELQKITAAEAKEIEPRVKTYQYALFSPTTALIDPGEVLKRMAEDARNRGVKLHFGVQYLGSKQEQVQTAQGSYKAGYVVNAAGLYADRVARDYGFGGNYRVLPFKGLYLYSQEEPGRLKTHVYPVPDLRNPFLGVHFTVAKDGRSKIGPTAIPAFWREQYSWTSNFKMRELAETGCQQTDLILRGGFDFKALAAEELRKYYRPYLVRQAGELVEGVKLANYRTWGRPGIRAQLVDRRSRTLEMDFVVEGNSRSMHVLNAVSPAFTCALPFSQYVVKEISRLMA